jgi:hypothetical protein
LILLVSEIYKINFDEVIEMSNNIRISLDGTKTIIKWPSDSPIPSFIPTLSWYDGPYEQEQILQITKGPDWVLQTN